MESTGWADVSWPGVDQIAGLEVIRVLRLNDEVFLILPEQDGIGNAKEFDPPVSQWVAGDRFRAGVKRQPIGGGLLTTRVRRTAAGWKGRSQKVS